VHVRTNKLGNKSFDLHYLITSVVDGVEQLTTNGYTTMVLYDYETNKSILIPPFLRDRISSFEKNLIQ
jgi:acyl-CoA thioester hydrolase